MKRHQVSPSCRSGIKALFATLAAVFALSTPLAAQERIEQPSLEMISPRDPQVGAQVALADAFGLFKAEGLDMTVRWVQTTQEVISLMAGGTQHLGTGISFSQVLFSGDKIPVRAVASLADVSGAIGLVLAPGVKLSHPRELEQMKLAYTRGTSMILILAKMADQYKFDMNKVQLVNMNPSEGVVAASKGDVQGLLSFQPNLYRLVQMGGTMYVTGSVSYVGGTPVTLQPDSKQYNHALLHVSETWIKQNPNTVKAVLRALKRATDIINNERPKALAALAKGLRVEPNAVAAMVDANKYGLTVSDDFARSIRFQSEWLMSIKRISNPVAPSQAIEPGLLRAIDPSLVSWDGK
jgi:NitT/TauT family transport system substrate-binding protein